MIRKGKVEDGMLIAKLKIDNYKDTYKKIFLERYLNKMSVLRENEKYIRDFNNKKILVYEEAGEILGYIYYGQRRNNLETLTKHKGEIYALYVDTKMQGEGIGTKLMKAALLDLIKDYESVILWCATANTGAVSFYTKRNFISSNKVKVKVGDSSILETAFLYEFKEIKNYKETRYLAYLEKKDVIVAYANFNLIFLKNNTSKWFKAILSSKEKLDIPMSFYRYLLEKELIEFA